MGEVSKLLSGPHIGLRMDRRIFLVLLAALVAPSHQEEDEIPTTIPEIYEPYTNSTTGCPCWWDLTKETECACCNTDVTDKKGKPVEVMACGAPQHHFCHRKSVRGCPGVPNRAHTLSQMGFPCFHKRGREERSCAWCVPGRVQCGNNPNICRPDKGNKKCEGNQGDCMHIPDACDPNATCVEKKYRKKSLYHCTCNEGYKGNGVQCFDQDGYLSIDPNMNVAVEIDVDSNFYAFPHVEGEYPEGDFMNRLNGTMSDSCTSPTAQCSLNSTNADPQADDEE